MEQELWKYLKDSQKPIVLYGMGNGADKIIKVLEKYGITYQGVFSSDDFVRDKYFHSHKISTYNALKEKFGDMIVLLCFGSQLESVMQNILKINAEQELFAPEVPVVGDGLFDEKFLHENKAEIKWVYDRLCDEISKKTFENLINYKISGKINYLTACQVPESEPYTSFLHLENENFLDLGAYNGDTVIKFIKNCENYKEITALEPDEKSFKKLIKNTQGVENIECINACASNEPKTVPFNMRGGRNSLIGVRGQNTPALSVDSLNKPFTYIKMDIEGEEVNAIKGAKNTILKQKPKMLISAYHRTDDLITIPKAVFDIRDDYQLYLRHFPYLPAWDTNLYFI